MNNSTKLPEIEFPLETDEWGLYKLRWLKSDVTDEAYSHPAKYSRGLIQWIYRHIVASNWATRDSKVIDPFGGVALGALCAMQYGMKWTGVELEPRWAGIAQQNLDLWKKKFGLDGGKIIQGDSRFLVKVLAENGEFHVEVSSPPYSETRVTGNGDEGTSQLRMPDGSFPRGKEGWEARKELGYRYGNSGNNLGNLQDSGFDVAASSPPFLQQSGGTNVTSTEGPLSDPALIARHRAGNSATHGYGETDGNIANLEEGDFDAAVSSPPFLYTKGGCNASENGSIDSGLMGRHSATVPGGYGETDGNIANLEEGDFDAAVSSPPFEDKSADGGWQMLGKYAQEGKLTVAQVNGDPNKLYPSWSPDRDTSYGETPGQLSKMEKGDFEIGVSSPPFTDVMNQGFEDRKKNYADTNAFGRSIGGDYGKTEGQMAEMDNHDFEAAVGSPPHGTEALGHKGDPSEIDIEKHLHSRTQDNSYGATPGQLGELSDNNFEIAASSPPYAETPVQKNHMTSSTRVDPSHPEYRPSWKKKFADGFDETSIEYGHEIGQMSDMKDKGFDVAASSPPYAEVEQAGSTKGLIEHGTGLTQGGACFGEYGEEPGQLGRMPDKEFDASTSSPPYDQQENDWQRVNVHPSSVLGEDNYGKTEGQAAESNSFWLAARSIVDQVYKVLKPGGHAVWVVKAYIKDKRIVDFPMMWAQLCVAAGFVPVHYHRCWMIEKGGNMADMFGEEHSFDKKRASFFRNLYEKKYPHNRIDYEVVLCMEKPEKEA